MIDDSYCKNNINSLYKDKTIYLDHAATTSIHPNVIKAIISELSNIGNGSSLHTSGRKARRRIEEAREVLANSIKCHPLDIIFTAGGTESNNLAIKGIYWARRKVNPKRKRIITTVIEHHAIYDTVKWLSKYEEAQITWLPVDAKGRVTPESLYLALNTGEGPNDVALITIMWANNEIGTIMSILEMSDIAKQFNIPIHSDAIQIIGQIPVNFISTGLTAMSIAAHKFGGPIGTGALILNHNISCMPLLHGGGQENDIRSGTLDIAGIIGMSIAADRAIKGLREFSIRMQLLRDHLISGIVFAIEDCYLNGPSSTERLPNNANFTFLNCDGDSLLMLLDSQGIECSTGAACTSGMAQPSHVLTALKNNSIANKSSLRFSLGYTNIISDIDAVLCTLPKVVEQSRKMSLANYKRTLL